MSSRRNIRYFLIFTLLFWTIGPLMVYVIDPYHIFHETRWNKDLHAKDNGKIYYIGSIRRNVVQSQDHDTMILGSSHTASFSISDIQKAIKGKDPVMFCLGGAHSQSLTLIAQQALSSKKIKYILWGIDAFAFSKEEHLPQKMCLYFRHPIFCCFDWQIILKSIHSAAHYFNFCNKPSCFLSDDFTTKHRVLNKDSDCKNWVTNHNLAKMRYLSPDFSDFALGFNSAFTDCENLLNLIKTYSDVYFVFPVCPVSWLYCHYYDAIQYPDFVQASFTLWRHLVTACADLPNVKIYGWHDCAFVSNLANYCDETHYHPDINRYMAWCIEHDKHRLTKDNYDAYEARCVENLRAFKILDAYPHRDTFDELVAAEY